MRETLHIPLIIPQMFMCQLFIFEFIIPAGEIFREHETVLEYKVIY